MSSAQAMSPTATSALNASRGAGSQRKSKRIFGSTNLCRDRLPRHSVTQPDGFHLLHQAAEFPALRISAPRFAPKEGVRVGHLIPGLLASSR
jgi:hypothetical protein